MRKLLFCLIICALAGFTHASECDGNIRFFVDGEQYCGVSIPCGESLTVEVYLMLEGATAGGITGVEYKLAFGPINVNSGGTTEDLSPDGLFIVEIPNPAAAAVLGSAATPPDPAPRGLNLAFSSCQTGDGTKVLLETLIITNTGCSPGEDPAEVEINAIRHDTPSNAFFQCPLATLCDDPAFTKVCLGNNLISCQAPVPPFPQAATCSSSGPFFLNPSPTSCAVEVAMDIKPGSYPNSINLRSRGLVPVAILTTEDFDALTIDVSSLAFGPAGVSIAHRDAHAEDVDGDGDLDVVAHFRVQETGLVCGDVSALLTGQTLDGISVFALDEVRLVKCN